MRSVGPLLLAAGLSLALTGVVTWPQILHPAGTFLGHHDTYFSIWRIGWIAHALATSPLHLFDANIFTPATGTLTYSDAMLLEGVIGAPLLWAKMSPVLVYNILLAVGYAGSGVGIFVLARHLTGQVAPALIAAAAFTLAPYRTEHIMHLELQWTMWIPLTLWAVHRTLHTSSWRWGTLAGVLFAFQVMSCVYYGVFLAILLCGLVPLLLLTEGRHALHPLPALALAAIVAAVLVLPYAWPYVQTSRELGARDMQEVLQYSARPANYLASPAISRFWGWTADRWGSNETRLFPGLIVVILAAVGLLHRSRQWVAVYAAGALFAIWLSLGVNSRPYYWLFEHLPLLQGLRSSARFGIMASAMLSVLAAFGAQSLIGRTGRRGIATTVLLAFMALDSSNRAFALTDDAIIEPSPIYRVIRSAGPGVIIELPVPTLSRLPGADANYSLWSLQHWFPLVNGYSGYYPPDYVYTMVRMETFPDAASIRTLKDHHVRYLVLHKAFYEPEQYNALVLRLASHPEFQPYGSYKDAIDDAALFLMEP